MEDRRRIVPGWGFVGAIVLTMIWAGGAGAYPTYRNDASPGTDDCFQCHGDFRASPYVSSQGGSWGDDLHDVHRNTMLGTDANRCSICHSTGNRVPVYLNQSIGTTGFDAISCIGCHGRQGDRGFRPNDCADSAATNGPCGDGAGLRQHHWIAGETVCGDCHSDANPLAFMPVGENVKPPYYFTPDVLHPTKPTDPCNPPPFFTGENYKGSTLGLDTDGDDSYDMADADCAAPTPTPTVTPVPTQTPVRTATRTASPIATPIATQSALATATRTASPTTTPVATQTALPTTTPTGLFTPVVTPTMLRTQTPAPTVTVTEAPTVMPTRTVTPTATPAPKNNCDAGKMQCVAKKQACLLAVHSKAARTGVAVDIAALRKCTDKFDGGTKGFAKGCIGKLESKEDPRKPETVCAVTGDLTVLEGKVDAFVDDVVSEIAENPAGPNDCNAGKTSCVRKKASCLLSVHQHAVKEGVPVDNAALQECRDEFDGGDKLEKGCILKLEAKQDPDKPMTLCSVTGDVGILEGKVDAFVADVVSEIQTTTPVATETALPTPVATQTVLQTATPPQAATPVPTPTTGTVVICHEHEHTIRVDVRSVSAHSAHGDTQGPCPPDDDDESDGDDDSHDNRLEGEKGRKGERAPSDN